MCSGRLICHNATWLQSCFISVWIVDIWIYANIMWEGFVVSGIFFRDVSRISTTMAKKWRNMGETEELIDTCGIA